MYVISGSQPKIHEGWVLNVTVRGLERVPPAAVSEVWLE